MQLTPIQTKILKANTRYTVGCLGRRSGKSTTALERIDRIARLNKDGTPAFNKNIWYVAPTYGMVKQIIWGALKQYYNPKAIKRIYESELSLVLVNGSRISLKGANNPDSLRGSMLGIDHVTLDEFAFFYDQDYVWTCLRPVLSDRNATLDVFSTPNGYEMFYDFYMRGLSNDPEFSEWTSFYCDSINAGVLSEREIQAAKDEMGYMQFQQEYMAKFTSSQAQIYYAFSQDNVVSDNSLLLSKDDPILIGLDFNVGKMCAVVGQKREEEKHLHIIDEIILYGDKSNTFDMMDEIKKRFPQKLHNKILIIPDASGRSSTSNARETNFDIIRKAGFRLHDFRKNPEVDDSINEVNGLLYNANNERRLYVNSKCKELITTLRKHCYVPGGGPDKAQGYDHVGDALRYLVHYAYPMQRKRVEVVRWS
jgi:hypothetical protein